MKPLCLNRAAILLSKPLIKNMTIKERIEKCRAGLEPSFVAKLPSGWFCLSEVQPVTGHIGYGVLYADPIAYGFNSLASAKRGQWGIDCGTCGDALIEVLGALRANYETWGNVDPSLHTHITARFESEPAELRLKTPREAYAWSNGVTLDFSTSEVQRIVLRLRAHIESRT